MNGNHEFTSVIQQAKEFLISELKDIKNAKWTAVMVEKERYIYDVVFDMRHATAYIGLFNHMNDGYTYPQYRKLQVQNVDYAISNDKKYIISSYLDEDAARSLFENGIDNLISIISEFHVEV
jgi:hypothetical protein